MAEQPVPEVHPHVPEAVEPPPGNPRFPLFDGLRAAAALGVLFAHCAAATLAGSSLLGHAIGDFQMGVTVFFVISGFLLYRPFVAGDMTGRGGPRTLTFYRRRALRIFPAYWFALAAFALLPGVISVFTHDWWWRYFLLIQNYSDPHLVFQAGIGPAWSLSVELAFYFLLPFFALGMSKVAGGDPNQRLVRDLCVLTVLAVVSATVRALLVSDINANGGLSSSLTWTATLTLPLFLTWFCIGMAFASVSAWCAQTGTTPDAVQRLARQPGFVWLIALGGYALIVLGTGPLIRGETPIHHLATGLVAAAFVFPAAFPHPQGEGLPARVLSVPAVAWIGLISYGIYLWADPITVMFLHGDSSLEFLALSSLVVVCAIAAAAFSYYVVERRFLRLKNPRPRRSRAREPVPQQVG